MIALNDSILRLKERHISRNKGVDKALGGGAKQGDDQEPTRWWGDERQCLLAIHTVSCAIGPWAFVVLG
jgi:hypothetical protein